MRVAMFSECYEPVQNGVSTSLRELVSELRHMRHNVVIVAPHFADHLDEQPFILRVPSFQTRFNQDYPVAYPWFPKLARNFEKLAPDVLHSHSPFFVGLLAARLARRRNLPLVSTYHTLYRHYAHYVFFLPDPAIQSLLEWWMPEYYSRCDCVIAPSRIAEESLRGFGVAAPVEVIPSGVPIPARKCIGEAAKAAARARWRIPPNAPLLLYVGRIAQEKNVELVIDSFAQVASEQPDARLLIVGGGPHLEACKAHAAATPYADRVVFAGPVEHDALPPVYACADLFVFGSSTETQGLVIAEARAAGTPGVVVNEGGASETVRDGEDGLVVPAELGAFASAVGAMLRNTAMRAEMSEACLRNALQWTPSAMAQRVTAVYDRARDSHQTRVKDKAPLGARRAH
jgi:1,2-diacylglycerol 3-alpha-glucosyltransferase